MAIEINLLPWREARRKKEKKQLIIIVLLSFIVVLSGCLLINKQICLRITRQLQRNQILSDEITLINKKLQVIKQLEKHQKMLLTQINLMQKIKNDQVLIVHLLTELAGLMPENVYLNTLQKKNKKIKLQGIAKSNKEVGSLLENIQRNPWMKNPSLVEIKKTSFSQVFSLHFILKPKQYNTELCE